MTFFAASVSSFFPSKSVISMQAESQPLFYLASMLHYEKLPQLVTRFAKQNTTGRHYRTLCTSDNVIDWGTPL
jgi:hypothetical protein